MRSNDLIIKELIPNISLEQLDKLYIYYETLVEESKKINLTTITEINDVYIKHFYDSILLSKSVDLHNKTLVDVGTGAGFPGIVLKIIEPTLDVTLIEPTTKRCNFLQLVIDKLNLTSIKVINDRAEIAITEAREKYDYATARAVSNLPILLELLTPFVKVNGYVVPMKGSDIEEELNKAKNAISKLSLELVKINTYSLPLDKGTRNILIFKKNKITQNIYPREYARIKKKPL